MKKILLAITIVCSGNLFSQSGIELSSLAVDRVTRQPIAYANVGFIDRGLGTVTDQEGYFELSFLEKRVTAKDTLQITAQGYYPLRIAFTGLQSILDKTKVLYLSKLPDDGETPKKTPKGDLIKDQVGSSANSKVTIGWSEKDMKGSEVASLVDLSAQMANLEQLRFTIAEHKADSTLVRINIYDIGSDVAPGDKLTKSIYHTIKRKDGEETIDLNAREITAYNQVIVGVELLESYGTDGNQLQLKMSDKIGTSFIKTTSQDSWQKLPYSAIGFSMDVLKLKSDEVANNSSADESSITGVVRSSKRPVQGCEVRVKGQLRYTHTKADGSFSIAAVEGDVLEFRSLITIPKDIQVQDQQNVEVSLKSKYDRLSEVVISSELEENDDDQIVYTALGPKKRRSLGYRSYYRERDQLNKFAYNIDQLIAGRIPGERGGVSFILSSRRTVVLDGVLFIGDVSFIDPNTVANVTLVPSLLGNVRYGTNGRNGVLYITTKAAMQNREFLERKQRANSLLVKGNEYNGLAKRYEKSSHFETSASSLKNSTSFEEAKAIYLRELEANLLNINFYREVFTYFLQWDEKYAYDILNTGIEIANDNPKALRGLAFIYEEKEKFGTAHRIYKRIGELEPQRSQTYLDLAQSYVSLKEFGKAFSLYKLILDNKIPGVVFGDSVLEVAVTEVKYLVTKHKIDVDYRDLHPSFYSKAQDLDGRIVFEWNDPQSEFDIQFVNPDNKYYTWKHTVVAEYKELERERAEGYNMKEFVLKESNPGIWLVNLKGHKTGEEEPGIPQFIKCTMYKNYGMPQESKQVKIIELKKTFENNISVASINLE
ncbi:hypothetical protein [uncultured Aquimarina sp.]|uniref:hypothetical protein n=1 Tax=uncultured Aquimarina sp. TaxID=575652 RepID=UPI0026181FAC|nr:hypothetical protein [uncultured Aquimarina sp.]